MNPSSKFGIAKRLYLVLVILIAALAVVAWASWSALTQVGQLAKATGELRVPQGERISLIELSVTRVSLQIRHAMLVRTPEDLAATLEDIAIKRRIIGETAAAYRSALTGREALNASAELDRLSEDFWPIADANIQLIQHGHKDEAFDHLVTKTIPARNRLLSWLAAEKARGAGALSMELGIIQTEARRTGLTLVGMVAAVAAGLMLFFWHIVQLIRRRVAASREVADRVSQGDLTQPVIDTSRDEFTPLIAALAGMQTNLIQIVSNVRDETAVMVTATGQIASGNQNLSARTEEQAASLEQTAASMGQLSSTAKQNAANARRADELAGSASEVAVRGGQAVRRVVGTMHSISRSSEKISEIIAVIDGIAFQTNILALNAAVEAARAGETGRGFAAVAAEVRSLAQRSAGAAKEIKSLINDSAREVAAGAREVQQAGDTMEEIVLSVLRVTDIIGEITQASREQIQGIEQVDHAVTQMDAVTQQNAALVEQAAAAAASLQDRACALAESVGIFKLYFGDALQSGLRTKP